MKVMNKTTNQRNYLVVSPANRTDLQLCKHKSKIDISGILYGDAGDQMLFLQTESTQHWNPAIPNVHSA